MPELEKDEEGEKKPETTEASEKSSHQHHGENCCWLLYKIENIFIRFSYIVMNICDQLSETGLDLEAPKNRRYIIPTITTTAIPIIHIFRFRSICKLSSLFLASTSCSSFFLFFSPAESIYCSFAARARYSSFYLFLITLSSALFRCWY